jgi:hypothetical protein
VLLKSLAWLTTVERNSFFSRLSRFTVAVCRGTGEGHADAV